MSIAFIQRCFQVVKQTHCALVSCDFKMSDCSFFIARIEYPPKWWNYNAVWLLHGWCHAKLLPSRRVLCTPYNVHYVTSLHGKATYVGCVVSAVGLGILKPEVKGDTQTTGETATAVFTITAQKHACHVFLFHLRLGCYGCLVSSLTCVSGGAYVLCIYSHAR